IRSTSESKLMSLAREWRLRSASFSSSSTIGFSNSRGCSFMVGLFENYRVSADEQGSKLGGSRRGDGDSRRRLVELVGVGAGRHVGVERAMLDGDGDPVPRAAESLVRENDAAAVVPGDLLDHFAGLFGIRHAFLVGGDLRGPV